MGEKGEGSGGEGGGKWGRRGREVGGKGEGTGNGVPPCPPPHLNLQLRVFTQFREKLFSMQITKAQIIQRTYAVLQIISRKYDS